ncbi:MAG: hypothetical protein M0036_11010 [Desulfobacteraceae bacterium]|nr:hypothetical protein [Desulfobacteraceae bacterium]
MKNLTTKIGSGATQRGGREVYINQGIALIRSQNVYDSEFVWSGLARISSEATNQVNTIEVLREDVLLNITGASILRTFFFDPEVVPARVNQHVTIIRAKPDIPSRFLHLYLLLPNTKEYLLGLNAGASREAIVTKGHIELTPIIEPTRKLLTKFQDIIKTVYSSTEQLGWQTRSLTALRDTLPPRRLSGQMCTSGHHFKKADTKVSRP